MKPRAVKLGARGASMVFTEYRVLVWSRPLATGYITEQTSDIGSLWHPVGALIL